MTGRQQRGRAPQQVRSGRDVAAGERPPPGRREVAAPSNTDLPNLLVVRRELLEGEERLFEVVPADLLELEDAIGCHALEPVDESDMKVGAGPLQQPVIRGLADQDMHEAIRFLAGEARLVRLHKLPVREAPQTLTGVAAHLVR